MKRYLSYIVFVVLSIAVIGCTKTETDSISSEVGQLTLQFSNRALTTRAAGAADDDHNEDLIKSVQLFFYTSNSDSEAAVYALKKDIDVSDFNDGKPNTTLSLIIPAGDMNTLFPNNATSCYIYAVANYAEDLTASKPSVADIKDKELVADFSVGQESFVMDGDLVKISKSGNTLTAEKTIELTRAAAKIELTVNVTNLTINSETWEANTADMKVSFFNGVKKGLIDDGSDVLNATVDHNGDYFDVKDRTFSAVGSSTTQFKQSVPFYSYTTRWEANAEDEVYLKLSIPWRVKTPDAEAYQTYYYLIPVNMDGKSLVRNSFYKITLDVKALGGQSEPITVNPSYVVLDWSTGEVNVDLSRPKYLVVDEHHYVINNETELEFLFHSSDECIITEATCTQTNLKTNETSTISRNDNATTVTNKSYALSINNETGTVKLVHGLNNDLYDSTDDTNGVFDFTPYEYTITIQHKNNSAFKETITITQYPAIHGYGDINSDYSNDGQYHTNDDNGFVWVNGYQGSYYKSDDRPSSGSNYSQSNFDDAQGSTDSSLKAVSMYVFTVSSLEGTEYVLGDPRTQSPNNLGEYNFKWASGKILGTNEMREGPMYYLPTDADLADGESSPTYNMIAPKFRVCSVYGAIDTNGARRYYENMKARCASYQEDGYPAGRWRLPTAAEFELINTLSMKGLLPALYATTMDYWCAHGYGRYDENQNKVVITPNKRDYGNSNYVSVRCVYDDWYWGSERALTTEDEKQTFTWGDAPRPTN